VAVFGGALLPVTVGAIADCFGLSTAFAVPLIGYIVIAIFALAARESGASARDTRAEGSQVGSQLAGRAR